MAAHKALAMRGRWILLALAVAWLLLHALAAEAQLGGGLTTGGLTIPNDNTRLGDWTKAGVETSTPGAGGVPDTSTWPTFSANVPTGSGCTGIATTNTNAQNMGDLQCILNYASTHAWGDGRTATVVTIAAGTYPFATTGNGLYVPSKVVIQGAGNTTILQIAGHDVCGSWASFTQGANGSSWTVTGGATQGSTSLTLSTAFTASNGTWVQVTETPDPAKVTGNCQNGTNQCFSHHYAKVTGGTGTTTMTIDRPLRDNFNGTTVKVTVWNPITFSAFQNLEIQRVVQSGNEAQNMIGVCGAADIWFSNVTFVQDHNDNVTQNHCIQANNMARSAVSASDFQGGSWSGNFVFLDASQDNLVQNNIWEHGYEAVIVQDFSSGNVVAYNYESSIDSGGFARSYISHGTWAHENLEEGDTGDGMITAADCFWGTQGPRETYFRNEKLKTSVDQDGVQMGINTNSQGCSNSPNNKIASFLNIVGNVFNEVAGRPGCTNAIATDCQPLDGPNGFGLTNTWGEKNRDIGNWARSYGGSFQGTTTWVGASSGVCTTNDAKCQGFFGPSISDKNQSPFPQILTTGYSGITEPTGWASFNLPASFYLTAKPTWWLNAPWPAVGADVTNTGSLHKIPAQCRYENSTIGDCATPNSVNFSCSPLTMTLGTAISCTELDSGTSTSWSWGDGTAACTTSPCSHTYASVGQFTIGLTDSIGTLTKINYITVNPSLGTLSLSASTSNVTTTSGIAAAAQSTTVKLSVTGTWNAGVASCTNGAGAVIQAALTSGTGAGSGDVVSITETGTNALTAGTYSCSIVFQSLQASPQTVTYTEILTVNPPPALLTISPDTFNPVIVLGQTAPTQSATITVSTGGASWTAGTPSQTWCQITPTSGTGIGGTPVSITMTGTGSLGAGVQTPCVIAITSSGSTGSPHNITVNLTVIQPVLGAQNSAGTQVWSLTTTTGTTASFGTPTGSFVVTLQPAGTWTASAVSCPTPTGGTAGKWVGLSAGSPGNTGGGAGDSVTLKLDGSIGGTISTSTLAPALYSCTWTISATGTTSITMSAFLAVNAVATPALSITPLAGFNAVTPQGVPINSVPSFNITNTGSSGISSAAIFPILCGCNVPGVRFILPAPSFQILYHAGEPTTVGGYYNGSTVGIPNVDSTRCPVGYFSGTFNVLDFAASNSPITLPCSLTVLAPIFGSGGGY